MRCDIFRKPELTVSKCWDARGSVSGQVRKGILLWGGTVRAVDKHGHQLAERSKSFLNRQRAEAWVEGTVRGMTSRSFGGTARRKKRYT
jgi:hypothetical protein